MFIYSEKDLEKQKIIKKINKLNKHKTKYITAEDLFYMLTSSIGFIVILLVTL